ncbi:hypothetical protein [Acrocarpospora catenulata]|nr:hypothetical protein [Acrocarpospora catenulata]
MAASRTLGHKIILLAAVMLECAEPQFLADPTQPAAPTDLLTATPTPGSP